MEVKDASNAREPRVKDDCASQNRYGRLPVYPTRHDLPLDAELIKQMKKCPACGKQYADDRSLCVIDGAVLESAGIAMQPEYSAAPS